MMLPPEWMRDIQLSASIASGADRPLPTARMTSFILWSPHENTDEGGGYLPCDSHT
jgi:hypothetical protein